MQEVTLAYGEQTVKFTAEVKTKTPSSQQEEKVLAEFDFDTEESGLASTGAKAEGSHALKDSYAESMGKALYLDGSASNFLNITDKNGKSLLAGISEMTVSYDMKPDRTDTNWVLYAAADDGEPVYNKEQYVGILEKGGTTTLERYLNSGSRPGSPSASTGSAWYHVDAVFTKAGTAIYVNGKKIQETASSYALENILGEEGVLYIGKANWGKAKNGGEFFKGYLDNFQIVNKALDEARVQELSKAFLAEQSLLAGATVGTAPDRAAALTWRGTDGHTAIRTVVDEEKKVITSYVRRGTDLSRVPVAFAFNGTPETITLDGKGFTNGSAADLSADRTVVMKSGKKELTYTLKKPILCNNPALPGQYADPDIDYFDGKFWIYPTTDGYPGWSGTQFHAFSSADLVNWEDEGVILDVADDNPGKNEKGVQIASSPWATGYAWAPSIEKKGEKYYFYYCGGTSADISSRSAIGVAVADHPAGPYVDKGTPLVTKEICAAVDVYVASAIDPSVFIDDDGSAYLTFGNGGGGSVIAKLTDDMMDIEEGSIRQITGLTDFRESVVITKKDGKYHWTWSCDDTGSPNYHVNYGVSDQLYQDDGTVNVQLVKRNLLAKDESLGILGTAHQSVVHITDVSGKERYFMAYHRFYTPLDIFISEDKFGNHRETCIDEIFFDKDGYMAIAPTLEGVSAVKVKEEQIKPDVPVESVILNKNSLTLEVGKSETLVATVRPEETADKTLSWKSDNEKVAVVGQNGKVTAKAAGTANVSVTAVNGKSASCKVAVKKAEPPKPPVVRVKSVKLDKKKLVLGVGEKFTLKAAVSPKNAANKKVGWKVSKKNIVSFKNGKFTAKKKGTAIVTATADGKKATCKVTVKAAPDQKAKVVLNKKSIILKLKGKSKAFQIKARISSKKYGCSSFKYSVDKKGKKLVKVDKSGKVIAKKKGTATITVKPYNGKGKGAKLKVIVKK